MRISSVLLLLLPLIFSGIEGFSQSTRKAMGKVTDTSGVAMSDATVLLIDQKDTLRTKTDADGIFTFNKVKSENFSLNISLLGYQNFKQDYVFGNKKALDLKDIKLRIAGNMLKEVVITSKPNPVRIMRDTIEYNVAAFKVFEGDNVADLIKQFPGLEVDDEYNVKSMGKNVVKLRVNGKDFFTNDVKEFIATLPAGIASKIQIIDDYGDEANFTGLKVGEPKKLINIVTKPGMNRGKFGNMSVNAGSNDQIGSKNKMNLWNEDKQTALGLNYLAQNNGAGDSRNASISISHRDKIGKKGNISFGYNLNQNDKAFINEQAVETLSDLGTYYNASQSNGKSKDGRHTFDTNFSNMNEKWYVNAGANASYNQNSNHNFSVNQQSGVTKQDFKNIGETDGRSPNASGNLNITKRLKSKKNHLSATFGFSMQSQKSNQLANTNTLYYNQQDQTLLKDSVLNRNIDNQNRSQGFSISTSYSTSIGKPKDSTASSSIRFNYSLSLTNSYDKSATSVLSNLTNEYRFIDTLSSELKSLFLDQSFGVSYIHGKKTSQFTIGMNARPVLLQNEYINLNQKINNYNLNYSPTFNYLKMLKELGSVGLSYFGNSNSPSPSQLQPIRNTQNLLNIIIGNPDLKPSFQHSLNGNLNFTKAKSGAIVFLSVNFSTTQNEIVNNVIVVPDTLGSYRQETRYENTNGTYNVNGNYSISIPIKKKLFTLAYSGNIGVSNKAIFINNVRYFNSGLNFSQNLKGTLTLKKALFTIDAGYNQVNNNNIMGLQESLSYFAAGNQVVMSYGPNVGSGTSIIPQTFNPGQLTTNQFFITRTFNSNFTGRFKSKNFNLNGSARYSYSANSNANLLNSSRDLQTISLVLNGDVTFEKVYKIGLNSSKRINSGLAIANQNPLILGVNLNRYFLKNKDLALTLSASDLLNQGNMVSRKVSGNSVIDSKNNVITRVFSIGLSYNPSKFGARGTNFRVDPD